MFRPKSLFQPRLWFTEITTPSTQGSLMAYQPFMRKYMLSGCDSVLINAVQTNGKWAEWFSAEQTAYALGQVTTVRALPTLIEFVTIATLLDSRIRIRDYFDDSLVDSITATLIKEGAVLEWKQVESSSYACVIGAGAAACIETHTGDEVLYLRFANHIAEAITNAQNGSELPRSLLGLQTHLQECIDRLLASARSKTLEHLIR